VVDMPVGIAGSIHDVIYSNDHAHIHVARQFFETKQRGAIGQSGNWSRAPAEICSHVVVPKPGKIAADRGSKHAEAIHLSSKCPAFREPFIENGSLKVVLCLCWYAIPGQTGHLNNATATVVALIFRTVLRPTIPPPATIAFGKFSADG
jgi:hypothetical protein